MTNKNLKLLYLLNPIFTFLFGLFLPFHRSSSPLHSLFKCKNTLKIKANIESHKSLDDFIISHLGMYVSE